MIRTANGTPFVEIADDDHVGLWITGQMPHGPAQERTFLFHLLCRPGVADRTPLVNDANIREVTNAIFVGEPRIFP